MPANLPPDAIKKWGEVEATHNPRDKLQRMEEFISLVPKHKGTMKLCGQVKKQMAVMRRDLEEKRKKGIGKGGGGPKFFIEKEGAAQIALLGLTNVGKSSLLSAVTNAKIEVSPNPYTTREPVPSIMNYQDVQFQIVEAPALIEGSADGRSWGLKSIGVARNSDGLLLMIDLSRDPVKQLQLIQSELEKARVLVKKPRGRVDIERKYAGASLRIIQTGRLIGCTMKEIEELLRSYHITDAIVKISGDVVLEEIEDSIFESTIYRPAVIVANKIDLKGAEANLRRLQKYVNNQIPIVAVSAEKRIGLEKIGENIFEGLRIIRVYTKEPGSKDYATNPFTLKKGSSLRDLAKSIHSDFHRNFAFAKVWAKRLAFSPQKVGLSFLLEDGDVVEIHLK
jgi:ribosome-interacting GTPase 1